MGALYRKFDSGVACIAGPGNVVGIGGAGADMLVAYLTNTLPDSKTDMVQADVPEIALGNGYSGPVDLFNESELADGFLLVKGKSFVFAATLGGFAPFRYVVIADKSLPGLPLIAWFDYGYEVRLLENETFLVLFDEQPIGELGAVFTVN